MTNLSKKGNKSRPMKVLIIVQICWIVVFAGLKFLPLGYEDSFTNQLMIYFSGLALLLTFLLGGIVLKDKEAAKWKGNIILFAAMNFLALMISILNWK